MTSPELPSFPAQPTGQWVDTQEYARGGLERAAPPRQQSGIPQAPGPFYAPQGPRASTGAVGHAVTSPELPTYPSNMDPSWQLGVTSQPQPQLRPGVRDMWSQLELAAAQSSIGPPSPNLLGTSVAAVPSASSGRELLQYPGADGQAAPSPELPTAKPDVGQRKHFAQNIQDMLSQLRSEASAAVHKTHPWPAAGSKAAATSEAEMLQYTMGQMTGQAATSPDLPSLFLDGERQRLRWHAQPFQLDDRDIWSDVQSAAYARPQAPARRAAASAAAPGSAEHELASFAGHAGHAATSPELPLFPQDAEPPQRQYPPARRSVDVWSQLKSAAQERMQAGASAAPLPDEVLQRMPFAGPAPGPELPACAEDSADLLLGQPWALAESQPFQLDDKQAWSRLQYSAPKPAQLQSVPPRSLQSQQQFAAGAAAGSMGHARTSPELPLFFSGAEVGRQPSRAAGQPLQRSVVEKFSGAQQPIRPTADHKPMRLGTPKSPQQGHIGHAVTESNLPLWTEFNSAERQPLWETRHQHQLEQVGQACAGETRMSQEPEIRRPDHLVSPGVQAHGHGSPTFSRQRAASQEGGQIQFLPRGPPGLSHPDPLFEASHLEGRMSTMQVMSLPDLPDYPGTDMPSNEAECSGRQRLDLLPEHSVASVRTEGDLAAFQPKPSLKANKRVKFEKSAIKKGAVPLRPAAAHGAAPRAPGCVRRGGGARALRFGAAAPLNFGAGQPMERSPPSLAQTEVAEEPVGPGEPVTLHVYDVGQLEDIGPEGVKALNKCLRPLGTGAFHCGVEVFGQEWSFKSEPFGTGVGNNRPRCCEDHSYCDSLEMGHTALSKPEVLRLIFRLEKEWPGSSYDSLRRNCCHFCDDLCVQLGVGHVPPWITHLAGAGAALVDTGSFLEGAFCSPGLLFCACMRYTPPTSTELTIVNAQCEAPVVAAAAGGDGKRGATTTSGAKRVRRVHLQRIEAMEVNGAVDDLPGDDVYAEEPVCNKCQSGWPLCMRSRCCAQPPPAVGPI